MGSTGAFTFDMTVPGGVAVETSGLTVVAVLPTHRRRGILRQMMRRPPRRRARARAGGGRPLRLRGEHLAALRLRHGALRGDVEIRRERTAFSPPGAAARGPDARVRLVSEAEALAVFPGIWERVRLGRPRGCSRAPTPGGAHAARPTRLAPRRPSPAPARAPRDRRAPGGVRALPLRLHHERRQPGHRRRRPWRPSATRPRPRARSGGTSSRSTSSPPSAPRSSPPTTRSSSSWPSPRGCTSAWSTACGCASSTWAQPSRSAGTARGRPW